MGVGGSLVTRNEVLPPPLIETEYGFVQGKRITLEDSYTCDVFLGIPFAKPPLGELRFKKPEKCEPWPGVKKCIKYGKRSLQVDQFWEYYTQSVPNSEDCLYLNVFAPKFQPDKKYPVFFFIHGGAWMMDSAVRFVPKKLCRQIVAQGIVMVSIQYRLGYMGFFCTGDEASKGNYGMFDMIMALQWTRDNIGKFGGDANEITVGGHSAGGVSADLLSISPISSHMFKRKICWGGNSASHWSVVKKDYIINYCLERAIKCGWKPSKEYSTKLEENEAMMAFLRTVPAKKLASELAGCKAFFDEAVVPLAPVYDGEFLPKNVKLLRQQAPQMDTVVGVAEYEGLLFIALGIGFLKADQKGIAKLHRQIEERAKDKLNPKEIIELSRHIYGDTELLRSSKPAMALMYVKMLSDIVNNHGLWRYMKYAQSRDHNTYVYQFEFMTKGMWGWLKDLIPFHGSTHGSEVIYALDINYFSSPVKKNKTEMKMCKLMSDYTCSFIKTGDPNSDETKMYHQWTPLPKAGPFEIFGITLTPRMKKEVFENRMLKMDRFMVEIMWNHENLEGHRLFTSHSTREVDISTNDVVEESLNGNDQDNSDAVHEIPDMLTDGEVREMPDVVPSETKEKSTTDKALKITKVVPAEKRKVPKSALPKRPKTRDPEGVEIEFRPKTATVQQENPHALASARE